MKSHEYQFDWRDIARICVPALIPAVAFALLMHGGVAAGVFPPPRHTRDTDQTILVHQAESSLRRQKAEVLFLGDSSCLMGLDAGLISEQLGIEALNLGALSFIDIKSMSGILQHYLETNPDQVRVVVMFQNASALRRASPEMYHTAFLEDFYDQVDPSKPQSPFQYVFCGLGLEIFRGRFVSRLLPSALPGVYGQYYGFSHDLDRFMTAHKGSAIDPGKQAFTGNAEYHLSEHNRKVSPAFRAVVPTNMTFLLGLTPLPQGFVDPKYPQRYRELLEEWGTHIGADQLLTNLPPTLPDELFARVTHLNAAGMAAYSKLVSAEIKRVMLERR